MMEKVIRHPKYYFDKGSFIFRAENTLYKLKHTILVMESAVFAELFEIGSVGQQQLEGKTDEDPIFLQCTVESFDLLVEFKFSW